MVVEVVVVVVVGVVGVAVAVAVAVGVAVAVAVAVPVVAVDSRKPKKLVDAQRVSRVFANGGRAASPPTPPASFKPYQARFKAQETS